MGISAVNGAFPMAISMRNNNFIMVIIPVDNKDECSVIEGINIIPFENVNDLVDYINNKLIIDAYSVKYSQLENINNYIEDFSDIKGQLAEIVRINFNCYYTVVINI